jgi:regulator of protease activity HflC (stomatin/prohibitin superfamily)
VSFPILTEWLVNNVFALFPVKKIHSYERGVRFWWGKDVAELKAGIYLYVPYFGSIEVVDIQQQTHNLVSQSMTSKDLLPITFSCNLTYRVKNARKNFTVVHNFDSSLENVVMMVAADEAAKRSWKELVSHREEIEAIILDRINETVKKWGAVVDSFAFTDLVTARQYRIFGDLPTL